MRTSPLQARCQTPGYYEEGVPRRGDADPGDEVILTDPTYAGMLNRVRLVGAVPRLVPLHLVDGEWRLDVDAPRAAMTGRTRVVLLDNASFPSGWVASDDEMDAAACICRERDVRLLYWGQARAGPSPGWTWRYSRTRTASAPRTAGRPLN